MPNEDQPELISHLPRGEKEDLLRFRDYAEAIYETLNELKPANTGLTIGIFGSWGSGKSSVLRMISELYAKHKTLTPKAGPIVVKFEAWEYAKEEVWIALLRRIHDQVRKAVPLRRIFLASLLRWWSRVKPRELLLWFLLWAVLPFFIFGVLSLVITPQSIGNFLQNVTDFSETPSPTTTSTPPPTATSTPSPTATSTPRVTGTPTATSTPRVTGTSTPRVTGTPTPSPTATPTPSPTATPTPSPTATPNQPTQTSRIQALLLIITALLTIMGTLWRFLNFLLGGFSKSFQKKLDQGDVYSVDMFRREMKVLIAAAGRKQPIVVLIDDLDRAPIEQIVPVLEAMKHFGSGLVLSPSELEGYQNAPIAFLLAADRLTLHRAIISHYKNFWQGTNSPEETEHFAREYLEKIVQIYFELPLLSDVSLQRLLDPIRKGVVAEISLEESPAEKAYRKAQLQDALLKSKRVFTHVPKENPRVVIQAHNTFVIAWKMIQKRFKEPSNILLPQLLAALIIIRYVWPEIFNRINLYPELFFYLYALATNEPNRVCSYTELEEILSLRHYPGNAGPKFEDIRTKTPNLTRLLSIINAKEGSENKNTTNKNPINNMSVVDLYSYLSLHPNIGPPSESNLDSLSESFMSGDPALIRFSDRVSKGEARREKERLLARLKILQSSSKFHPPHTEPRKQVFDAQDRLAEEQMLLALIAIGRVGDNTAVDPLKRIIDERSVYPQAVIDRAIFALAHLASRLQSGEDYDAALHMLTAVYLDERVDAGTHRWVFHLLLYFADRIANQEIRKVIAHIALRRDQPLWRNEAQELVRTGKWFDEALEVMRSGDVTHDVLGAFRKILFEKGRGQQTADMSEQKGGLPQNVSTYLIELIVDGKREQAIQKEALNILDTVPNPELAIEYLLVTAQQAAEQELPHLIRDAMKQAVEKFRASQLPTWHTERWEAIRRVLNARTQPYWEQYFLALQNINLPEAIAALGRELQHPDPEIKKRARQALEEVALSTNEALAAIAENLLEEG